MTTVLLGAVLALLPAGAVRGAHDTRRPDAEVAILVRAPDAPVDVVWLEGLMVMVDGAPVAPAPRDPVSYLGRTQIRVRTGFTPDAARAIDTGL